MPTTVAPNLKIVPARGDAIRVVPLSVAVDAAKSTLEAAAAASAPLPNLTYRNGPLLTNVEVFTVFWGAAWQLQANAALLANLNRFFEEILVSPLIDQLAEYSVTGQVIGHGMRTGTLTITTPVLGTSVTDTAIQHTLQNLIATDATLPRPGPNTLYFLYCRQA